METASEGDAGSRAVLNPANGFFVRFDLDTASGLKRYITFKGKLHAGISLLMCVQYLGVVICVETGVAAGAADCSPKTRGDGFLAPDEGAFFRRGFHQVYIERVLAGRCIAREDEQIWNDVGRTAFGTGFQHGVLSSAWIFVIWLCECLLYGFLSGFAGQVI
jgi:hypothetical protein